MGSQFHSKIFKISLTFFRKFPHKNNTQPFIILIGFAISVHVREIGNAERGKLTN